MIAGLVSPLRQEHLELMRRRRQCQGDLAILCVDMAVRQLACDTQSVGCHASQLIDALKQYQEQRNPDFQSPVIHGTGPVPSSANPCKSPVSLEKGQTE